MQTWYREEDSLLLILCETIEQPYYIMKIQDGGAREIGDNQILFCQTQKYYFHVFQ